jgi:hypothetical protein
VIRIGRSDSCPTYRTRPRNKYGEMKPRSSVAALRTQSRMRQSEVALARSDARFLNPCGFETSIPRDPLGRGEATRLRSLSLVQRLFAHVQAVIGRPTVLPTFIICVARLLSGAHPCLRRRTAAF